MSCCALLPLGLFVLFGPLTAAGRGGLRPFLLTLAVGWGLVAGLILLSGPIGLVSNWRDEMPAIVVLAAALALSVGLGGVTVWARAAENREVDSSRCRRCGYDLRASPAVCPECGTPTRPGPERV